MTVTTGGRGFRFSLRLFLGDFQNHFFFEGDDADDAVKRLAPELVAVGTSSAWLMLAKTPRSSSVFSKSLARTSSFSASSRMVMPSVMVMSRGARGSGGAMTAAIASARSPT